MERKNRSRQEPPGRREDLKAPAIYNTFPSYQSAGSGAVQVARTFSGDDNYDKYSGTDDHPSQDADLPQAQSMIDETTDAETGLDYREVSLGSHGLADDADGRGGGDTLLFAVTFAMFAAVQVFAGLWNGCYSLVAFSVLGMYSASLNVTDCMPRSDPADKLYAVSAVTVVVVGVGGSVACAIIVYALSMPPIHRSGISWSLVLVTTLASLIPAAAAARTNFLRLSFPGRDGGVSVGSTSYSIQAPDQGERRPVFSAGGRGAPGGPSAAAAAAAATARSSSGGPYGWVLGALWIFQSAGILLIVVLAWRKAYGAFITQVDLAIAMTYCGLDLLLFLAHLRSRIHAVVVSSLQAEKQNIRRLDEQLDIAKEAVEMAERRREQGEIRLLRLLQMEKDNASAERDKANAKAAGAARKIHALQSQLERSKRDLKKISSVSRKKEEELKTYRFQSTVARAEAVQLQGKVARAEALERVISVEVGKLKHAISTASSDQIKHVLITFCERVEASMTGESPEPTGEGLVPEEESSSNGNTNPDATGQSPSSEKGSDPKSPSEEPSGAKKKEATDEKTRDRLLELEEQNKHLEERNRITMRQVTSRMQQLQDAVETQGHHIAAKESVLSALKDQCTSLNKENKILKVELGRVRAVASYLESGWQHSESRNNTRMEQVKAELEEMNRQLATGAESEARLKKIKEAENILGDIRPSLGISIAMMPPNSERKEGMGGIEIKKVNPDGVLYGKGIRSGHTLLYMNAVRTDSDKTVREVMATFKPGDLLMMLLGTTGEDTSNYTVTIELPFAYRSPEKHGRLLGMRQLRDIWRLETGLIRRTDLDPDVIAVQSRGGVLKPRARRSLAARSNK